MQGSAMIKAARIITHHVVDCHAILVAVPCVIAAQIFPNHISRPDNQDVAPFGIGNVRQFAVWVNVLYELIHSYHKRTKGRLLRPLEVNRSHTERGNGTRRQEVQLHK